MIKKIQTKIQSGALVYYAGRRIIKIKFETMNLGGDLKVRLFGSRYLTTINIHDIKFVSKKAVVKKILELEQKRKQAENNAAVQKTKEAALKDVRVRSSFWLQAANDYSQEINSLVVFHAKKS